MSDSTQGLITIGGRQFVASRLTLGVLRQNGPALNTIMEMRAQSSDFKRLPTAAEFDAITSLLAASLSPIGDPIPDFPAFISELDMIAGMREIFIALAAVMTSSGYVPKPAGEAAATGEATSAVAST